MIGQLAIAEVGAPLERVRERSQWFTPASLARRAVSWAVPYAVEHWTALEPSAGNGRFVDELVRRGLDVTAHEIDPRFVVELRSKNNFAHVIEGDYLAARAPEQPYDLAAINPPYEGGLDGEFLRKVMDESERFVAVLRTDALQGKGRYENVWSRGGVVAIALLVGRPRFDGPSAGSPEHEFCVVKWRRGYAGTPAVEWWT